MKSKTTVAEILIVVIGVVAALALVVGCVWLGWKGVVLLFHILYFLFWIHTWKTLGIIAILVAIETASDWIKIQKHRAGMRVEE